MTANKSNRATSDNSVSSSPRAKTENVTLQRNPRLQSTVQQINNRNDTVTARKIERVAQEASL